MSCTSVGSMSSRGGKRGGNMHTNTHANNVSRVDFVTIKYNGEPHTTASTNLSQAFFFFSCKASRQTRGTLNKNCGLRSSLHGGRV